MPVSDPSYDPPPAHQIRHSDFRSQAPDPPPAQKNSTLRLSVTGPFTQGNRRRSPPFFPDFRSQAPLQKETNTNADIAGIRSLLRFPAGPRNPTLRISATCSRSPAAQQNSTLRLSVSGFPPPLSPTFGHRLIYRRESATRYFQNLQKTTHDVI